MARDYLSRTQGWPERLWRLIAYGGQGRAISGGDVPGMRHIAKHGRNPATGTSFVTLTSDGNYRMPTPSNAATLRIRSGGNANDDANGTGAREVTIEGLDANGNRQIASVATAGTNASANFPGTWLRAYLIVVSKSGSYWDQSTPSQAASIIIEDANTGEEWAEIENGNIPRGEAQIGAISVPAGEQAYITDFSFSAASDKKTDIVLVQRRDILDESPPYAPARQIVEYNNVAQPFEFIASNPFGPFPPLTDLVWFAKIDSTPVSPVTVTTELILEKL